MEPEKIFVDVKRLLSIDVDKGLDGRVPQYAGYSMALHQDIRVIDFRMVSILRDG